MEIYKDVKHLPPNHLRDDPASTVISEPYFLLVHEDGKKIFGAVPFLALLLEVDEPLFHEAGVFIPSVERDEIFVTSNRLLGRTYQSQSIQISKLSRQNDMDFLWELEDIPEGKIVMPNGAVNYLPPKAGSVINQPCDHSRILFCSQGNHSVPASLAVMDAMAPYETRILLNNFFGRPFNSPNDVVFAKDGSIWFTDPIYGVEQGFRPRPQIPSQLYRYDQVNEDIRVVADGFQRPNGLAFSPDEQTLYVTDTDWIHGDGTTDDSRVSTIYAFSVQKFNQSPFLANKRVFAMADTGAPDGIKLDLNGNVYCGCGDGINIWNSGGMLLGKIVVPGGVSNFCFGRAGELFILNEKKFWVAEISKDVQGALLKNMGIPV